MFEIHTKDSDIFEENKKLVIDFDSQNIISIFFEKGKILIKDNIDTELEFDHGQAMEGEQQQSCIDYSKAKAELNWQPEVDLEQGVKQTVEWFKGGSL